MTHEAVTPIDLDPWAPPEVAAKLMPTDGGPTRTRGIYFVWRPGGEVVGPRHVCAERRCGPGCTLDGEVRGEWWAVWYDAHGGRHREKAGTKAAALDLYRRRKTEVRRAVKFPEPMQGRDLRLKDLVAEYLEAVRADRAKTADVIARRLVVVVDMLGDPPAESIQPEDLDRLKVKLATGTRTAHRKPASINRFLQDLKAVFGKAAASGRLDRNPFAGVALLNEDNLRARELSPEEEIRLFQALPTDPPALCPYFRFLLETGCRAGEACGLLWPHILWSDEAAELPGTTGGRREHLTLSKAALDILGALPRDGERVFCWPDGRPFTVDYTTKAFLRATRAAGIPDLRQQDLRHAFAMRRLRGGANLAQVSDLLRHVSTRAMERYLPMAPTVLKRAVKVGQPEPAAIRTAIDVDVRVQYSKNNR